MKRRNIDENFNFFESYHVLKQETNYRLHSHQHSPGRLGLKNISRLQLLRLMSNIVTRSEDMSSLISHSELVGILQAVFRSKLSGKKFETVSYSRWKKILNAESDSLSNISFKIYNSIKKYFEKVTKTANDAEHYYQGLCVRTG